MSTDDADLADLLASPPSSSAEGNDNKKPSPRYDNGDDDKYKKDDPPPTKRSSDLKHRPHSRSRLVNASLSDYLFAYISLCCHYHPFFCSLVVFGLVAVALMLLANLVANPMQVYGVLNHDHFNINSKLDLSMGKIDHWCLGGGNDHCRCEDPLTPSSQLERRAWVEAFKQNKRDIQVYRDPLKALELDVAFLGSSIVEEMDGRWLGIERSPQLRTIKQIFDQHFRKDHGAEVEGVALGIAGDTSPNVLYRLMHGELPEYFNPKVWWLVLGLNDLGRMECSEEVTVLGILRVVEEILEAKPNARIVINSLFPMVTMRGDKYALISDYEDTFRGTTSTTSVATEEAAPARPEAGGRRLDTVFRSFDNAPQRQYNVAYDARDANMSPEELRESIQQEEMMREKRAHLRRSRDPINPLMNENIHRIRKFRPLSAFLAKRKVPLWSSIQAINAELKAFADKQERVYYFDSTAQFAQKQKESDKYILMTDRISPKGHPTAVGYLLWEDEVVTRLKALLEVMKVEQPELFVSHELDANHHDEGTEHVPSDENEPEPEEGGILDPFARDDDSAGNSELWEGEVDPEYQDVFQELPPQDAPGADPNGGVAQESDGSAPIDGGDSVPASEQTADGAPPTPPSNVEGMPPSSGENPQDSTGHEEPSDPVVPEQPDSAQLPPADPQQVTEPQNSPPPPPDESQQQSQPDEQNPQPPPPEEQQESQPEPVADQPAEGAPP